MSIQFFYYGCGKAADNDQDVECTCYDESPSWCHCECYACSGARREEIKKLITREQ